jgi:DNA repair exonuclease SbcCD ATPase subunit
MKIRHLELQNFMSHKTTKVDLPDLGVVLIAGPNGGGKTSLYEGVATALWNETTRGTLPWAGPNASVRVVTDTFEVTRTRLNDRTKLTWNLLGQKPAKFETPTKAQKAFEAIVGEYQTWRYTRLFTSQDAVMFSTSTDAERKRLLETVLALGRYEAAHQLCKVELRELAAKVGASKHAIERIQAQLEADRVREQDHKLQQAELPAEITKEERLLRKQLFASAEEIKQDIRGTTLQSQQFERTLGLVEGEAARTARDLKTWQERQTCPTCTQKVEQALIASLGVKADAAAAKAGKAKLEAEEALVAANAELASLNDELAAMLGQAVDLDNKIQRSDTAEIQRRRVASVLAELALSISQAEAKLQADSAALSLAEAQVADLQIVERVLHYQGFRAHVLGTALHALEAATNAWLLNFSTSISVKLEGYTEKKSGGVADAIALKVEGSGGGYGYHGSSGGERRRVDIAFLLALSQIAEAAAGQQNQPLMLDEVFDTLDEDGVRGVVGVLDKLAETRQVFVVSHSELLINYLNPALHLRVDGGTVEVL